MSLVAVVGDCATTTALGLVATWPAGEPAFLVEFDPAGGCASAWLDLPRAPGLSELAAAATAGTWSTIEHTIQQSASGVAALVAPTRPVEAAAAVAAAAPTVLPVLSAIEDRVAVADGGRLRSGLSALVVQAGFVVIGHRQHAGSAAAAAVGLERLAETCAALSVRSVPHAVALIGDRPYRADEVARFVATPLVVDVALDPWAAAVFSGRAASAARLRRAPLWRSLTELSGVVAAGLRQATHELVWAPAEQADGTAASHG